MQDAHDVSGDTPLLPSQAETYARLLNAARSTPYVVMTGQPGMGRTLLLRRLAAETGGAYIGVEEIFASLHKHNVLRLSEAIYELIASAMAEHGTVIFDDFFAAMQMGASRLYWSRFASNGLVSALRDLPVKQERVLVVGGNRLDTWEPASQHYGAAVVHIEAQPLVAEDYAAFLGAKWGARASQVDIPAVFRAAPELDLYQLSLLANLLRDQAILTTEQVLACLEEDVLSSNLHIDEVEALSFGSLPGSERIVEALEQHIILPFENRELAEKYEVRPRRGVLLYGPPGTGKTSIGRALAHRMSGRFFLIDGTVVSEPPTSFFSRVQAIVNEAKACAPSVLFIDDADVLFQIEHIQGLKRYLLSLLDGLESESSNNVCVILTAMDAQKVPEALLRSGRIELWLETKAPDAETRAKIVSRWLPQSIEGLAEVDFDRIASETEGFTPADLRRLAGDARLLYAADLKAGRSHRSATDYFSLAIEELVATRAIMAQRLADDALLVRPYA